MNYNIPREELKECLSTYLFELSKLEKQIDNNSETKYDFSDVENVENVEKVEKVLEEYYQTNIESFKFLKTQLNLLIHKL